MMATITALRAQKRNPNRINVDLDGEFAFGLSRVVAAWLQVGQELNDEKITRLQAEDEREVALQKAIHFLSYRPRTESEIRRKLAEQGFEEDVVNGALERLRSNQMVGDGKFARLWIDSRVTFRPRSHRLMAMELRQKGVADETIDAALAEAPEDEILAYQAGQARFRRYAGTDFKTFQQKLGAYLGRKGFSYGVISPVVQRLWRELQAAGEEVAASGPEPSEH
ncbi:MAG: RecX family transcriptional regulator [Anaerolineae bacterium]|nr:RecX family transcriptional regulator [Anaerolineae bacterium]